MLAFYRVRIIRYICLFSIVSCFHHAFILTCWKTSGTIQSNHPQENSAPSFHTLPIFQCSVSPSLVVFFRIGNSRPSSALALRLCSPGLPSFCAGALSFCGICSGSRWDLLRLAAHRLPWFASPFQLWRCAVAPVALCSSLLVFASLVLSALLCSFCGSPSARLRIAYI